MILREGHGVAVGAVESTGLRIEVLVVVFRLGRRVDENVRLRDRRAREVVGTECGLVGDRAPVEWKLLTIVAELE